MDQEEEIGPQGKGMHVRLPSEGPIGPSGHRPGWTGVEMTRGAVGDRPNWAECRDPGKARPDLQEPRRSTDTWA